MADVEASSPVEVHDRVRFGHRLSRGSAGVTLAAALAVLLALVVAGVLALLEPWSDDSIARPTEVGEERVAAEVVVPDVGGLVLAQAVDIVREAGLDGGAMSGPGWSDPDHPSALVVSQKPPAGTEVVQGSVVGFRTALITSELCAILTELPDHGGDAHDLADAPGYWDVLRKAQTQALGPLSDYIEQLLEHHRAGGTLEDSPSRALGSVALHHRACSRAKR